MLQKVSQPIKNTNRYGFPDHVKAKQVTIMVTLNLDPIQGTYSKPEDFINANILSCRYVEQVEVL